MSKREKTVTRSFRISESALKALEEDARSRQISLNTLVNQLLLAHTNWGRFIDKVGAIRTPKQTFRLLLDASPDEAIVKAARFSVPDINKSMIIAKYGALSVNAVLDYMRNAAMYGGFAEYTEIESQGRKVITGTHDLGPKGSLFIKSAVESLFGMVGIQCKISSSEHSVNVEI